MLPYLQSLGHLLYAPCSTLLSCVRQVAPSRKCIAFMFPCSHYVQLSFAPKAATATKSDKTKASASKKRE